MTVVGQSVPSPAQCECYFREGTPKSAIFTVRFVPSVDMIMSERQIALDPVAEFAEAGVLFDRFYTDQQNSERGR